jgi:hypothetical protein
MINWVNHVRTRASNAIPDYLPRPYDTLAAMTIKTPELFEWKRGTIEIVSSGGRISFTESANVATTRRCGTTWCNNTRTFGLFVGVYNFFANPAGGGRTAMRRTLIRRGRAQRVIGIGAQSHQGKT